MTGSLLPQASLAQEIVLPALRSRPVQQAGLVQLSPSYNPPVLKGIKIDANNPFRFEFVLDKGDNSHPEGARATEGSQKQDSSAPKAHQNDYLRLIKYFLAAITVPEQDLWVNLSPYEKDRIIPDAFGKTEMGRDLLAQDYILKQITASLMYPEDEVGKKFWKRVYEESARKFGNTNIPVNTFNKVWIVPEKAVVYENVKNGTAYVVESKLKVMLEEDYHALARAGPAPELAVLSSRHPSPRGVAMETTKDPLTLRAKQPDSGSPATLAAQIIREVLIPQLYKEINEGQNFAQLRQVYNSLILATWYKKKLKQSILSQVYADKNKVQGVGYTKTVILSEAKDLKQDPSSLKSVPQDDGDIEAIYQRYLQSFKKGAYNFIKEELDPVTHQAVARKYFSGGVKFDFGLDGVMGISSTSFSGQLPDQAAIVDVRLEDARIDSRDPAQVSAEQMAQVMFQEFLSRVRQGDNNHEIADQIWRYFMNFIKFNDLTTAVNQKHYGQEQVRVFAQRIGQAWSLHQFEDVFGSIYQWMSIRLLFDYGPDERMKYLYQIIDWFTQDAPLQERAFSLWHALVHNNLHLRHEGPHSKELDSRLMSGNGIGEGLIQKYILTLIAMGLHNSNKVEYLKPSSIYEGKDERFSVEDMLLWGLVMAVDPTIHVQMRFYEQNPLMVQQEMQKFMKGVFSDKRLGPYKAEVEQLLYKAFTVTDKQWQAKGFVSPYRIGIARSSLDGLVMAPGIFEDQHWKGYPLDNRLLMFALAKKYRPSSIFEWDEESVEDYLYPEMSERYMNVAFRGHARGLRSIYGGVYQGSEMLALFPSLSRLDFTSAQGNLRRFMQMIKRSVKDLAMTTDDHVEKIPIKYYTSEEFNKDFNKEETEQVYQQILDLNEQIKQSSEFYQIDDGRLHSQHDALAKTMFGRKFILAFQESAGPGGEIHRKIKGYIFFDLEFENESTIFYIAKDPGFKEEYLGIELMRRAVEYLHSRNVKNIYALVHSGLARQTEQDEKQNKEQGQKGKDGKGEMGQNRAVKFFTLLPTVIPGLHLRDITFSKGQQGDEWAYFSFYYAPDKETTELDEQGQAIKVKYFLKFERGRDLQDLLHFEEVLKEFNDLNAKNNELLTAMGKANELQKKHLFAMLDQLVERYRQMSLFLKDKQEVDVDMKIIEDIMANVKSRLEDVEVGQLQSDFHAKVNVRLIARNWAEFSAEEKNRITFHDLVNIIHQKSLNMQDKLFQMVLDPQTRAPRLVVNVDGGSGRRLRFNLVLSKNLDSQKGVPETLKIAALAFVRDEIMTQDHLRFNPQRLVFSVKEGDTVISMKTGGFTASLQVAQGRGIHLHYEGVRHLYPNGAYLVKEVLRSALEKKGFDVPRNDDTYSFDASYAFGLPGQSTDNAEEKLVFLARALRSLAGFDEDYENKEHGDLLLSSDLANLLLAQGGSLNRKEPYSGKQSLTYDFLQDHAMGSVPENSGSGIKPVKSNQIGFEVAEDVMDMIEAKQDELRNEARKMMDQLPTNSPWRKYWMNAAEVPVAEVVRDPNDEEKGSIRTPYQVAYYINFLEARREVLKMILMGIKNELSLSEYQRQLDVIHRAQLIGSKGEYIYAGSWRKDIRFGKEKQEEFRKEVLSERYDMNGNFRLHSLENSFIKMNGFLKLDMGATRYVLINTIVDFYTANMRLFLPWTSGAANNSVFMNICNAMLRLKGLKGISHDLLDTYTTTSSQNFYRMFLEIVLIANPDLKSDNSLRDDIAGMNWDQAQTTDAKSDNRGGIDLTSDKVLQVKSTEEGVIDFNFDPIQLQKLQNAPGFQPVITSIRELPPGEAGAQALRTFLALDK